MPQSNQRRYSDTMPQLNLRRYSVGVDEPDAVRLDEIRHRDGISINAQMRKGVALWLEQKDRERAILDAAHHRKEKKTA